MKKLFKDLFIYENFLIAYFSNEQKLKVLLNDKVNTIMERFLEKYIDEDNRKGTMHVEIIQTVYSNPQFCDRTEYFKSLHISNSTLQRSRESYCQTLSLLFERYSDS